MNWSIHEKGICESKQIGAGTRIWAFTHILPGAKLGKDCNICDHVFIENDVTIGDRVTIKCGVQLWDGIRIEDDVFVGPNATFTNDRFPRSKQYPEAFLQTTVGKGASIGANATILPGLSIGAHAMVGAGAVVTRSVPSYAIVIGNPARVVGYTNAEEPVKPEVSTDIPGVVLRRLKNATDMRGSLSVGEFTKDIPFDVKRYFLVYDVPTAKVRGEHAHIDCHQFLVCVKGSCSVIVDDGERKQEILLDSSSMGLYIPPMIWATQHKYTSDAMLLVFASHWYDLKDYIRDYQEFQALRKKR